MLPGSMLLPSDVPRGVAGDPQAAVSPFSPRPTTWRRATDLPCPPQSGTPILPYGPTVFPQGFGRLKAPTAPIG